MWEACVVLSEERVVLGLLVDAVLNMPGSLGKFGYTD
jgi:hypothetical protein